MKIERHLQEHRYSGVVVHNSTAYFAAIGIDKQGAPFAEQAKDLLRRIDEKLALAGSKKSQLLSVAVFIDDLADLPEFNKIWDEWVAPNASHSRHAVQAKPPFPGVLVECHCIAAV